MKELLDRIALLTTGVRASEISDDDPEIGLPGIGDLADCRVIFGYDKIQDRIPEEYYPIIIFEPGDDSESLADEGNQRLEITSDVAVRVPGKLGALFGITGGARGVLEISDTLKALLYENEYLEVDGVPYTSAIVSYHTSPSVSMAGKWIGKRYAFSRITFEKVRFR